MSNLSNSVLNGTNEVTNQDIGQIRVIETESGIEMKYHITDRERFFSQYSLFAIKTAQSTVEMCRVVFEAKEELSRDEFSNFCTDIGHKGEDSTIRKYLAIGAAYERLIQYADKLPNSWTSIYKITQIDSTTFSALVSTDNTFATMRAKDIDLLINPNKASQSKSTQNSSNQSTAAATAESNVVASDDLVDDQIDAAEADIEIEADVESIKVNDIEPQSQADDLSDTAQDVEDTLTSDTLAETEESKKSITVNEIEQLSDDFHVVIKFKTQPSKAKFKEFVTLMKNLKDYNEFNLDIEMFNDKFVTYSNDINQQTLNAISKIASDSEISALNLEKK
jgi:hypothetical protein